MIFVPQRKHDGPAKYVTGDSFTFVYVDDGFTSQKTHDGPESSVTEIAFLL
jgi:hypothetical protein